MTARWIMRVENLAVLVTAMAIFHATAQPWLTIAFGATWYTASVVGFIQGIWRGRELRTPQANIHRRKR